MLELFCNSFFAAWFADLKPCGDDANPNTVALLEALFESVEDNTHLLVVKANCPDRYQRAVLLMVVKMLLDSEVRADADGNIQIKSPNAPPRMYVKRDKVGYVEREYVHIKPQCEDCENAKKAIHDELSLILDSCSGAMVGGTNYGCEIVEHCCGNR